MWYHRKLKKLKYNKNIFNDIIQYAETTNWIDGYDQNGLLWNVKELPLSSNEFPILNELYTGLNAEFKRKSFFISSVQAGGLVNHIDHRKWGNIAFPLIGDFANSPQYFYDQFNHPVEQFILDCPVIFNTRMLHAVPKDINDCSKRWILVMDIFDWPDNLFNKIDKNNIWIDTENFKYG